MQSVGRFLWKVITWPARLSLPGRFALLTALLLVTLALTVWWIIRTNPKHVSLYHVLTWDRIAIVVVLLIVIPIIVYRGLKLWLEGEKSMFPEIDYAWKSGLKALSDHGLAIDAIPIFLVLGSAGEQQEAALADASGRGFRVRNVPEGPAPFHWFANPDGIYLFCTNIGSLSALATLVHNRAPAFSGQDVESAVAASPPAPAPAAANPAPPTESIRGTLTLDGSGAPAAEQFASPAPAAAPASPNADLRGTMMFQPESEPAAAPVQTVSSAPRRTAPPPPAIAREQPALLPAKQAAEERRRLQYLCRLIDRERAALCGINGVVTLLPFESIEASVTDAEELEKAVRSDVTTVQRTLKLRVPVVALVVGLEQERGFSELVRRVGRERAAVQRFGRGFDVRSFASAEELEAFGAHVCGAFEDWVYTLFREQDALMRTGNTRLYGLLCKIRCNLKGRLTEILADGFGSDAKRHPDDDFILFSGCYFAASGPTEDRQAFVKGVFDKLEEEQEEVEWSSRALADDRRNRWLVIAAVTLSTAMVLSLAGMVFLAGR